MADTNTNSVRNIEVESSLSKLDEIQRKTDDSNELVTSLEANFLSQFEGNYDSAKAIALKNEIEGMKKSLKDINNELENLRNISSGYVQSTENVDEG